MVVKTELYLLRLIGGVKPTILGPYVNDKERDRCAIEIKREIVNGGDLDGLFMLDVTPGYKLATHAYSKGFFWDAGIE